MLRRLSIALALLASLLVPSIARAAPAWTVGAQVPSTAAPWSQVSMGTDGAGALTAAHVDLDPGPAPFHSRAVVSGRRAGTAWTSELTYPSSADELPISASVAVAPGGAAVLCVVAYAGSTLSTAPWRFLGAIRAAGATTWSTVTNLVTDPVHTTATPECHPAVSRDGQAAILVGEHVASTAQNVGDNTTLQLFSYDPAGDYWAPTQVSTPGDSADDGALAFDASGALTILWRERYTGGSTAATTDDQSTVEVRRRNPISGILGAPVELSPGHSAKTTVVDPVLGVGPDGHAIAAWDWSKGGGFGQLWASAREASTGSWGAPVQLATSGMDEGDPLAATVTPGGTPYVLYTLTFEGRGTADIIRGSAGGGWSAGVTLTGGGDRITAGALDVSGEDAVFDYGGALGDHGAGFAEASRWLRAASSPEPVSDLVEQGDTASPVQGVSVAADGQGGAFATWSIADGAIYHAFNAAYDASPPALAVSDVPSMATAGTVLTMHASAADLWSPLPAHAPTWDFGDGTSATGATVTHAWAAAGSFTVAVEASDALGNAVSQNFLISVAAAAGQPPFGPGASPPPPTPAPAVDHVVPSLKLTDPACPKHTTAAACARLRRLASSWRTLRGTASDTGGSGLSRVEVAVAFGTGERVSAFDGKRFAKSTKTKAATTFARAALRAPTWSLRLPKLARGTYVVRLRAVDGAGNTSLLLTRTLHLS